MISKKISQYVVVSLGVFLSCNALAESSPTPYKYGAKLDIAKVLSITTPKTHSCKPVDQVMRYVDSAGKVQVLKYRALSDACSKGH